MSSSPRASARTARRPPREIETLGRRAWPLAVDLGDPASVEALAESGAGGDAAPSRARDNSALAWVAPTLAYPLRRLGAHVRRERSAARGN